MSDSYYVDQSVICECIDAKTGTIKTPGGLKQVFIMDLYTDDLKLPLIKYFNVTLTQNGNNYTVKQNSDFAKLYRLTIGEVKKDKFYRSQHLLGHFSGHRFKVKYESASLGKGKPYLKVTHIEPEIPKRSQAWTVTGLLKKVRKQPVFTEANYAELPQNYCRKSAESPQNFRSEETLEASKTLGLQPFSIPLKQLTCNRNTLTHAVVGEDKKPATVKTAEVEIQKPVNRVFYHERLPSETVDEFYNRVIDETFLSDLEVF